MASRRRYVSTEISCDSKLAELADHGTLPLLLYTWAIPHADDWGRMNGDARQFKLTVCPALDVSAREVDEALDQIAACGLWLRYTVGDRRYIAFPTRQWFHYQSYVPKEKRQEDGSTIPAPEVTEYTLAALPTPDETETPQNAAERRESPQNASSRARTPSPSPSPSPSLSPTPPSVAHESETSDAAAPRAPTHAHARGVQPTTQPSPSVGGDPFILETETTLARWQALGKQRARPPSLEALHGVFQRHQQRGMGIEALRCEIAKLEDEAAASNGSSPVRPLTLTRLDNWLDKWHAPPPAKPGAAPGARATSGGGRRAPGEPAPLVPASQTTRYWEDGPGGATGSSPLPSSLPGVIDLAAATAARATARLPDQQAPPRSATVGNLAAAVVSLAGGQPS